MTATTKHSVTVEFYVEAENETEALCAVQGALNAYQERAATDLMDDAPLADYIVRKINA